MTNISAAAISRILKGAGIRKAPTSDTWGVGFVTTGYSVEVGVHYQDTDRKRTLAELDKIVSIINNRKDQKYWAVRKSGEHGGEWVKVTLRAEESPEVVSEREVRVVLGRSRRFYAHDNQGAGYYLQREDNAVRVFFRDHDFTSYAPETGGREKHTTKMIESYAQVLVEAGYSATIDYQEGVDSVLVTPKGKSQAEAADDARKPLLALREAVEEDDLAYMTRKAGPTSVFVYYLVPFKDKVRRCEVFYSEGVYKLSPRFGGPMSEFYNLAFLVAEIGHELRD